MFTFILIMHRFSMFIDFQVRKKINSDGKSITYLFTLSFQALRAILGEIGWK